MRLLLAPALTVVVMLGSAPPGGAQTDTPADRPAPRTDRNSQIAHEQLVRKAKAGRIAVYFTGDSIVRRWGALDYPELLANWTANFSGWHAATSGGARTESSTCCGGSRTASLMACTPR